MSRGKEYVEDFLAHYASEYYDPAKAREYYLRTRELKGQQNTSDLTVKYTQAGKVSKKGKVGKSVQKVDRARTDERKQAWAYAKNQIGEHKKADLKALSEERKQIVDHARESSQARREEISTKLSNLLELLTNKRVDDAEQIEANETAALEKVEKRRADESRRIRQEAERKVDAIPAVPDGVVGPQRERLVAARNKKIARITGDAAREIGVVRNQANTEREAVSADADAKRKDLSTKTADQKVGEREAATANRERVTSELKATVDKARADYEAGKARLIAEYEAKQQDEFDAIKANV